MCRAAIVSELRSALSWGTLARMKAALLVLLPIAITSCAAQAPPPAAPQAPIPSMSQPAPLPSAPPPLPVAANDSSPPAKLDGPADNDDGPLPSCPKVVPSAAPLPAASAPPVAPSPAPGSTSEAGVKGAVAGGPPNVVVPFDLTRMERPKRLSGQLPNYGRKARRACAQGTVIAKCVIGKTGGLTSCRIIRSLPPLDEAVLDALATWQMTPVLFQGSPVACEYTIPFKFQLQ